MSPSYAPPIYISRAAILISRFLASVARDKRALSVFAQDKVLDGSTLPYFLYTFFNPNLKSYVGGIFRLLLFVHLVNCHGYLAAIDTETGVMHVLGEEDRNQLKKQKRQVISPGHQHDGGKSGGRERCAASVIWREHYSPSGRRLCPQLLGRKIAAAGKIRVVRCERSCRTVGKRIDWLTDRDRQEIGTARTSRLGLPLFAPVP